MFLKKCVNFPPFFEKGTTKLIYKISRILYPMWRESNTIKLDIIVPLNFSQGLNIKMVMQFSLHKNWSFSLKYFLVNENKLTGSFVHIY